MKELVKTEDLDEGEESWEPREVLVASASCDSDRDFNRTFFRSDPAACHRLTHVVVMYRDEYGEPSSLVETWAPAELIPASALAQDETPVALVDWLVEHREITITRVEERVGVKWPPDHEESGLLEQARSGRPIIRWSASLIDSEGRCVVWQTRRLTNDCILDFNTGPESLREVEERYTVLRTSWNT